MTFISKSYVSAVQFRFLERLASKGTLAGRYLPNSASLDVSFVSSAAEIPGEFADGGYPEPLEGPWLYKVLEHSGLEKQFTFLYALVFERGVPAAAAPAFVMDVPMVQVCPEKLLNALKAIARFLPSILYQRTLFVGYPTAAQGVIGIVPEVDRRAILLALQNAFEKKARELGAELIIWRDLPEDIAQGLEYLTEHRRLFRTKSLPSTIVRFKSSNKEDYFKQLTAPHRWALKRNLKRSAAAISVSTEVMRHPAPEVLVEMYGLFRQTYFRAKMKFEELPLAWFERIAALPTTHFLVMREKQTGAMIAATACFDRKPMLVARHVGFDYSKPMAWMLYYRLWDALVDWTLANGFNSIYSGPTSYAAKIQTGHELIPLFNYLWHKNPFMHAIYRTVAQRLDWAALDSDLAKFLKAHPSAGAATPAPRETGAEVKASCFGASRA